MKKELHFANSVQALNDLAQKNIKKIKPDKLYNSAEKLFQTGLQKLDDGDEEFAYILFVRFILIYTFLDEVNDKRYTKQRLGREHTTVTEQLSKLEESLRIRYEDQEKDDVIVPVIIDNSKSENNTDSTICFPSGYITCSELYGLINKKVDMVIFDSRLRGHYLQSRMKHPNCVNIPEEIIHPGSSANTLGKQVSNESKAQWDRRWKSSITILMDWSSTKETITASKLSLLKDILVHWDTTMVESKPPVVLNGGYLEWLQMYPMLCTNPDVVHEVQNSVLNDLLDLDLIEYPSADETMLTSYLKPPSLQPTINRATKPQTQQKTEDKILDLKHNDTSSGNLEELWTKRNLKDEEEMRFELQQREEKLLEDKAALEKSKQELNEENEQLKRKIISMTDNADITPKPKEDEYDIREKLLQEAREKKKHLILHPDIYSEANITRVKNLHFKKRMSITGKLVTEPGVAGLNNLGFTCYMNSVLQCYSNTRLFYNFFVLETHPDGEDFDFTDKRIGEVSKELKNVFGRLWTGLYKYVIPNRLKAAVDRYGPRFKGRDQHDAHEFLLSLNNWLHDDLKREIKRPLQVIWTPRQRNWMASTDGMTSIVLETFCGQQLNIISCEECHKRKTKLELFEHLSLALPSQGTCTLEDCLNTYYRKQLIQDYTCQTCKNNKQVSIEMKVVGHPPVVVLCLKRFSEGIVNGDYAFIKNIVSVNYPLENLNLFGSIYHLYGVIVHSTSGVTLDSGHYYAIIKNLLSKQWLKYDDNVVYEVNRNEAIKPNDAYILFYQSDAEEMASYTQFKKER